MRDDAGVDGGDDFDPRALGFRCGLEIHQQLDTEKKLFCRCPVGYKKGEADIVILRHMRPTLSEMGTYDGTALMEFKTRKEILYEVFEDSVCTYEMDDTPPFPINREALEIALEITMLFGCSVVDELHVSRKQYLDGSIPTGFQRTAITGINGRVPYKDRFIRIRQVSVEEDACREMWDRGHTIAFRTDRLGTPLVEVVTEPDILSPEEVAEVAGLLGRAMRGTGKVRRGMGATRQDINVSIEGGTRVEIKGVPKLQWMEALTRNEARRQKALLDIRDELLGRGLSPEKVVGERAFITDLFRDREGFFAPIREAVEMGGVVGGVCLKGFGGILRWETQRSPDGSVPFLREFEGRVRVIACLDGEPNLLDLRGMEENGFPRDLLNGIKKRLGFEDGDDVIVVWGPEKDVKTALEEVATRAKEALMGVPNETRQPFPDGTTGFERILPGPDRMYPDTDHPPVPLTEEFLENVARKLSTPAWERENRMIAEGVPSVWAKHISADPVLWEFYGLGVDAGLPPPRVAWVLYDVFRYLRRRGVDIREMDRGRVKRAFEVLAGGVPAWRWIRWLGDEAEEPHVPSYEEVAGAVEEFCLEKGGCDFRSLFSFLLERFDGWVPVGVVREVAEKYGIGPGAGAGDESALQRG